MVFRRQAGRLSVERSPTGHQAVARLPMRPSSTPWMTGLVIPG